MVEEGREEGQDGQVRKGGRETGERQEREEEDQGIVYSYSLHNETTPYQTGCEVMDSF